MHPSVAFRFHSQGYVKKERHLLSDAPFGRFPEALARRRPRIRGGIFLPFFNLISLQKCPLQSISRTADFVRLVALVRGGRGRLRLVLSAVLAVLREHCVYEN